MRLSKLLPAVAVGGLLIAAPSNAAVVLTGVTTDGGIISSYTDTDPLIFTLAPKAGMTQRIRIDIFSGSIVSATGGDFYRLDTDRILALDDGTPVNAGNNFEGLETCSFNGSVTACDGGVTSAKLNIIGSRARSAIFEWSLPADDPHCDPNAIGCYAEYAWAGYGSLDLVVKSNRPVPYRVSVNNFPTGGAAVPEPASWAMMVAGFGAVGSLSRRRKRTSEVRLA